MDNNSSNDTIPPTWETPASPTLSQCAWENYQGSYGMHPGETPTSNKTTPQASQVDSPIPLFAHSPVSHGMLPPATPVNTSHMKEDIQEVSELSIRKRKRKAPTLKEKDWEPFKSRIIELHITNNLPLKVVKTTMENEGFSATERQYRTRISSWGLDKHIKSHEMHFISQKKTQRRICDPQRPNLHFRVRGAIVASDKIERWIHRNDSSSQTQDHSSPSMVLAKTPAGLSYSTGSEKGSVLASPIASPPVMPIVRFSVPPSPSLSISTTDLLTTSAFQGQSPKLPILSPSAIAGQMSTNVIDGLPTSLSQSAGSSLSTTQSEEVRRRRELSQLESRYGETSIEVCDAVRGLAIMFQHQGRYASAEQFAKRDVQLSRQIYGEQHRRTSNALLWLSLVFHAQDQFSQAEKFVRRAEHIIKELEGPDSVSAADCYSILSAILHATGRMRDAFLLRQRTLQIFQQQTGTTTYQTLRALDFLAESHVSLGRWDESERFCLRALSIIGQPHSKDLSGWILLMNCVHTLASTYHKQNRATDAEQLLLNRMPLAQETLGPEHPNIINCMVELGKIYLIQGRYTEAEILCLKVLQTAEKVLGGSHSYVFVGKNLLVRVFLEQQKFDQAEGIISDGLRKIEASGTFNHVRTYYLEDLARIRKAQGRLEEATALLNESLGCHELSQFENHPTILALRGTLKSWEAELESAYWTR